jgi:excisionase family DNA binding protein
VAIYDLGEAVFTTREAARYLGLAEDTIRRYIYRGLIRAAKQGRDYAVTRQECDRYRKHRRPRGNPNFLRS